MCFGEGLGLADLHWGGFTNQWGNKKRINGADEKSLSFIFWKQTHESIDLILM
jgi:hypothetical protein